jgi:hypothetical protein
VADFPEEERRYNQSLDGVFGTFGSGADSQIFFVQTAITPQQLDRVSLISDIPGSETWSVRDLFQRDVDIERVTNSLIPYFLDDAKLKFFNPLALTILPLDPKNNQLLPELPLISPVTVEEENRKWTCIELPDFFRFKHPENRNQWGKVEWCDTRVRIVAIDGQHRLSALKRIKADLEQKGGDSDFFSWTIPVVIFSMRALSPRAHHSRILDVVRNIFVYINTEAKKPSVTRQILLSDESVVDLCAQELLEYAHENDVQPDIHKRDRTRLPLIFFDWKGYESYDSGGKEPVSPAAVKSIREVRDWLEYYVLGDDFSDAQEIALGVQPTDALKRVFKEKKLRPEHAKLLRKQFQMQVLPGIAYLLEHFPPYQLYAKDLRDLEDEFQAKSDIARHAFHKIRFGDNRASLELAPQVKAVEREIIQKIAYFKTLRFTALTADDIGMRGVMCAFGELKGVLMKFQNGIDGWRTYAEWFVDGLKKLWETDLLREVGDGKPPMLRHIAYDHNEGVVNYRLEQAESALGAFVGLFVLSYGRKGAGLKTKEYDVLREGYVETLSDTIFRGYKREVKPLLRDRYPSGGKPLNEAVAKEAKKRADKQLDKLLAAVNSVAP